MAVRIAREIRGREISSALDAVTRCCGAPTPTLALMQVLVFLEPEEAARAGAGAGARRRRYMQCSEWSHLVRAVCRLWRRAALDNALWHTFLAVKYTRVFSTLCSRHEEHAALHSKCWRACRIAGHCVTPRRLAAHIHRVCKKLGRWIYIGSRRRRRGRGRRRARDAARARVCGGVEICGTAREDGVR